MVAALAAALLQGCGSQPGHTPDRRPPLLVDFGAVEGSLRAEDATVHLAEGALELECRGRRAWVEIPVAVDAADFNVLEVTLEAEGGSHHAPFVAWSADGRTWRGEDRAKFPPLASGATTENRRAYCVHVDREPGWVGRISAIRLHPTDNPGRIRVASVRFRSLGLWDLAEIHGNPEELRTLKIGSETRRGFYLEEGGRAEERRASPGPARLDFALGVPEYRWKRAEGPVVWRVTVGEVTDARVVFEREVDGRSREADRGWLEASVDLDIPRGRSVRIVWEAESVGGTQRELPAFVAHPALVPEGTAASRPNVLLVSLDTLRADHLGAWGHGRETSPALDRLARESIQFTEAKAQAAKTLPSHMSLFTSLHAGVHEVIDETDRLPEGWATLAGALGEAGYHTAAFTEDAFVSAVFGFVAGFDRYHDGDYHLLEGREQARGGDVRATVTRACDFVARNVDRPFFLFLHTYEPHTPYCPEPPFDELFREAYEGPIPSCVTEAFVRSMTEGKKGTSPADLERIVSLYDGEIRFADHLVGRLLETIDTLGIRDRTYVIVTSDHGEDFADHRAIGRHGHTVYEELLHVPLLIRTPGGEGRGAIASQPVGLVDLAPTILDLLGLAAPPTFEGRSFAPILRGGAWEEARPVFAENRSVFQRVSVQAGAWKYIRNLGWNPRKTDSADRIDAVSRGVYGSDVAEELYRIDEDPQERVNLAEEAHDEIPRLRAMVDAFLARAERARREGPRRTGGAAVDDAVLEKLRELGYVGETR